VSSRVTRSRWRPYQRTATGMPCSCVCGRSVRPATPAIAPVSTAPSSRDATARPWILSPAPPPAPAPVEDIVFQSVAPAPAAPESSDIFSDHTRKAMEEAFNSIPDEDEPAPQPARVAAPVPHVDGATVESVFERAVRESFEPVLEKYLSDNTSTVIERMKPLIREWMDEHFPALLEGAVRAEVERVVKARGTKR